MFSFLNLNKNRKDIDALTAATLNQRCSIINFLFMIYLFDDKSGSLEGEQLINNCINVLDTNKPLCLSRIDKHGVMGILIDLENLTNGQKANLTLLVIDLMLTDPDLKEAKIEFVKNRIEALGLDGEKFTETLFFMKLRRVTNLLGTLTKKAIINKSN